MSASPHHRNQESWSDSSASTPKVSQGALAEGSWPHALSHEPLLRVSDVLSLVQPEFPALTTSKLRFLDSQGLVSPRRTPSGYRQYSPADVERLRFVLRQQRDHYRPLTVISDHLLALDEGRMQAAVVPHVVDGEEPDFVAATDLALRAGVDAHVVTQLDESGLIQQHAPDKYDRSLVTLVAAAGAYLRAGGDLRAIRTLRNAAMREVNLAHSTAAPVLAKGQHGEAEALTEEFAEAAISLFGAYVRHGLQ